MSQRLYSCRLGTSWTLIEAASTDLARRAVAERLGLDRKPWLWDRISVRPASPEDIARYGAIADAGRSKSRPDKPRREPTAKKLARKVDPELFPDDAA